MKARFAMFAVSYVSRFGVYIYQVTDTGLSATLTVPGTKFIKDPDMN